ncbi:MAG: hypothetical protein HQL58_06265, partial [Magnetococcales bacterium]|nr:hypothetical protein [Magnetococcales bacterium]
MATSVWYVYSDDGYYNSGDTISITVVFTSSVTVTGTPQLTLETGTTDEVVSYVSGSGSRYLVFSYTVQSGDTSSDLDYVSTSSLSLNGGTIATSGTAATLTLPSTGSGFSLSGMSDVVVDTTAPTVTSVSSTTSDGSYVTGDVIAITVVFSEAVTVTGTPYLTLETGTTDRNVSYSSGSGSTTLVFNYTVQSGDSSSDLDYTSTSALALNSGTIADAAGNSATLTLASPGASGSLSANKALVVVSAPTQTVTIATLTDDVGSVTGTIATSGSTDDTTPTLTGTISASLGSSESVAIYRGGTKIGTASVTSTSWSYSDSGVSNGNSYSYTARVENSSGGTGTTSSAYVVTIDTTAPTLTVSGVDISTDSGTSASDFWTNTSSQTITGTLSSSLSTGDILYGSVDNGSNWT